MAQNWAWLPTPPDSPRKRRQQLRESEEVSGMMQIEDYIYRTDSYRSTSMQHPPPLPYRTEPADRRTTEEVEALGTDIFAILETHGFPRARMTGMPVVQRLLKPGYPSYNPTTVLRIVYRDIRLPRPMGPAKDELLDLLRRSGIANVEVEILDIEKTFRPSLFAISATAPEVREYESSKAKMIEVLENTLRGAWKTMCMYQFGQNKRKSSPTVVITVDPRARCNWHKLMLELREVQPMVSHLPVEFLPGGLGDLAGNSQFDSMQDYGIAQVGESITVAGEQGGGTLGLFAHLTYGETTYWGFLTNFHVVRPAKSAEADVINRANRHGSSLHIDDGTRCQVVRFAPKDITETVLDGQQRAEELKAELRGLHQRKYYLELKNTPIPRDINTSTTEYEKLLARYERRLGVAATMPTGIGRVLLSSGATMWNNRVGDWAFVQMFENITYQPFTFPTIPSPQKPSRGLNYQEGMPLAGFGEMKANEWYFKVGKSTGLTSGVCNGVQVSCRWNAGDSVRHDMSGNQLIVEPKVTEEFVILSEVGDHVQTDFCKPGDSGSVLINRWGRVCGLLYGSTYTYAGIDLNVYAGLAMTMPDVKETIKLKSRNNDGQHAVLEL
ncbi:uncharacterized protein ASPGLDRAFT_137340 [Aspergillus glaucus CBS 516.65]|uniref:Uncharacterized protein n=1 Tax=Aspergillus glaucus CBS 516.65 TaxID=1160497 RepID=A0A1L9V5V6_ASPGL|nr:hypothetical protein ASPGLDRAFT_137340 [Aspergillus glaucus CBS 516.65]OJJ79259.1 hypothetical protein ASPGLDRAFT_137340 [Aspergillus glaucus CBS 516.65]